MQSNRKLWLLKNVVIFTILFIVTLHSSMLAEEKKSDSLTIGIILPLSTSSKLFAEPIKKGIFLSFFETFGSPKVLIKDKQYLYKDAPRFGYNNKDTRIDIKVIIKDDNSNEDTAEDLSEQLATIHNVIIIIGSGNSSCTARVRDVGVKYKFPVITPISSATRLAEAHSSGLFFRVQGVDSNKMKLVSEHLLFEQGAKKVIVFYENDPWYGEGLRTDLVRAFRKQMFYGFQEFTFKRDKGKEAFVQHRKEVMNYNPDAAAILGLDPDVVSIAMCLWDAGFDIPVYFTGDSEKYLSKIPMNNAYSVGMLYFKNSPQYLVQRFNRNFRRYYNEEPGSSAAHGYDTGHIFIHALQKVMKEEQNFIKLPLFEKRKRLARAIGSQDFDGVIGRIKFDKFGNPNYRLSLTPIRDVAKPMNERGWWILVSIGFIVLIVVCIFGIIYLKSRRRRYQQSKKILKANNIEINIEKKKRKKLYKENSEDKHVIKTNFNRPKVFIGSSSEGEDVARAIQQELGKHCEPVIWDQNPYDPSARVTEELLKVGIEFDFAVLVLTADDLVKKRDVEGYAPRDNVIFELGFFMGCIGCERTFMIYPEDASLALPSDIHGLLRVKFKWPSKKKFLRAAVGPACTLILDRILGERIKL